MGGRYVVQVICRILFDVIPCPGPPWGEDPHGFGCASHTHRVCSHTQMLGSTGTGFHPESRSVVIASILAACEPDY